jgi:hypothetical protein
MIDQANSTFNSYKKKITSYLDGSLTADEKSEFEAFVRTHPEFESLLEVKKGEVLLLKSMIPAVIPSRETCEFLESEMKMSVFNLLKGRPKNITEKIKNFWEEWINR